MSEEKNLFENGFEEYPFWWVFLQNIFLLIYFGTGFAGIWKLQIYRIPFVSITYIIFIVIMLLFVLRKHLCTNCYYYGKRCNTGWGKIALIFRKNSGNYKTGTALAGLTWMLVTLIPVTGFIIILFSNFSLVLFVLFVLLTPVNFIIHKKACETCKMRFICPASMAKTI
jgi:hypothetical protein